MYLPLAFAIPVFLAALSPLCGMFMIRNRSSPVIKACAKETESKVVPICFDVTDSSALKSGLMSIYKTEGRIDCVVNNAAIIANQKLGMVTKPLLEK